MMPGHAGSPYWAAVDFESEGDDDQAPPGHRIYVDPWDNEAYGIIQAEATESSQEENFNSFVGEPVSASFYYVPTKNYESDEDVPPKRKNVTPPHEILPPEYAIYGRKMSRPVMPEYHPEMPIYEERSKRHRRRSLYIEEPIYAAHPMLYEPLYGPIIPPPPGYHPPLPRSRMSLPHHPEFMMANLMQNKRRHSRLTDAYDYCAYETLSPEYEDWARPFPQSAPENFHLSRYGHLQIDYSCSWNSLDRLIRNQN